MYNRVETQTLLNDLKYQRGFNMGLFMKKIGPVFLKETSDTVEFIKKMQELKEKAEGNTRKIVEKQISLARYGEIGESNVAFELKSSGLDMYILHDIYLETESLSAQIDYLVVTRKHIYVIECKNLIGNIEIDNAGNFIRTYELFGKRVKEGIYSPTTQNKRHLQVLKEIRKESKSNFLTKMLFESGFEDNYKSLVVLANPKTYLNAKYAKKEIREQVIRADQLIEYIQRMDESSKNAAMSEGNMLAIAEFFLEKNKSQRSDYARKYEEMEITINQPEDKKEVVIEAKTVKVGEKKLPEKAGNIDDVKGKLRAWRLRKSRSEGYKPYYIFNDEQMEDLIEKNPKTKEELLKISGFGIVKVEKYGEDILRILAGQT